MARPFSCLLLAVLAASPARADLLTATRGQPLVEVSHAVDLTVRDGVATYVVRWAGPSRL